MPVFNNVLAGASGGAGGSEYQIERSLRFSRDDSAHLSKAFGSGGNRKTWTWSCWLKRTQLGNQEFLFTGVTSSGHGTNFEFDSEDQFKIYHYEGSEGFNVELTRRFRDINAWYHIVVAFDTTQNTETDRIKIYVNGVLEDSNFATSNYPNKDTLWQINNNVTHYIFAKSWNGSINDYGNGYLADIHFVDNQALDSSSFGELDINGVWQPKKFSGSYGTTGFHLDFADNSSNAALGNDAAGSNTWTVHNLRSSATANIDITGFIATSGPGSGDNIANYAFDGDTSSNRLYAHGFGVHHIAIDTSSTPIPISSSDTLTIYWSTSTTNPRNTELTLTFNNSSSTTYSAFNRTSGVQNNTITVGYTGSITGIRLEETSGSSPGEISLRAIAKNGVFYNFAPDSDCLRDSPSQISEQTDTGIGGEIISNYCVLNPQDPTSATIRNGNLDCDLGNAPTHVRGTFQISEGKWFWEITPKFPFTAKMLIGICVPSQVFNGDLVASGGFTYFHNGNKYSNGSASSYGESYTTNDVIGVAFDADAGTLGFYKNGKFQGTAFTGLNDKYFPAISDTDSGNTSAFIANFGQRAFAYPPGTNPIYSQNVSGPLSASPYNIERAFDGDLTTYADHSGQNSTWTFTRTFQSVSSLRVYIHGGNSTNTVTTVGVSGTQTDTIPTNFGPGWHTISLGTTGDEINSIAFTRGGSGNPLSVYAIEVNNTVLVDGAGALHKTLNTYNIAPPLIADGSKYFDAKLWDGNGDPTRTISGYNFSPDFIWIDNTTGSNGWQHVLYDRIRGAGTSSVTKSLSSNDTRSESSGNDKNHGYLSDFTNDGFDLAKGSQAGGSYVNHNGWRYIGWAWDAGDATNPTQIAVGSLNSSVYDQRTLWRNAVSGSLESGQSNATLFNNSSQGIHASSNSTLTFTTPGGYALSGTLEVHMARGTGASAAYGDYDVKVNGTSVFDHSKFPYNTNAIVNLGTFSNITSIEWGYGGNSANDWIQLNDIRVNGKELIDSDVTTSNVPSVASEVRAQPSAGFSICKWTGTGANANVGHGLNTVPDLYIVKRLENAASWQVYHGALGATYYGALNAPDQFITTGGTSRWNDTAPTSAVFSVGTNATVNAQNETYVAYCFSSVAGYSSVGSFQGNGSTDGPFVFTGFRSRFILIKSSSRTGNWQIYDTTRDTFNPMDSRIKANETNIEASQSGYNLDVYSNGFKPTGGNNDNYNEAGATYLYAAFAEHPFNSSRAR